MNLNYLRHAKCSESTGKCLVAKKRSKCKMLVQIQTVRIYAIMYFNGKIWSDEGKFKLSKFESKHFHWIIINLISCGMLFHWATLLSEGTRIELATLPQKLPFRIQLFPLLLPVHDTIILAMIRTTLVLVFMCNQEFVEVSFVSNYY